tara:strand:+ start:350 stop:670 length:321 start_codon:yes stop_codon:yes gene_type:complete
MSDSKGIVKYDIVRTDTVELDIEHIISRFIDIIDRELEGCYIYPSAPELDCYDSNDGCVEINLRGLDEIIHAGDISWKNLFLKDIDELADMVLDAEQSEELRKSSE